MLFGGERCTCSVGLGRGMIVGVVVIVVIVGHPSETSDIITMTWGRLLGAS